MAPKDTRLKVRTPEGWVGPVAATWGEHCTVEIYKSGYYRIFKMDDLVPISEEEFAKKWR